MPTKVPQEIKYRIGLFEAGWMLGVAFFIWGLMVLFSGLIIGEAASEFLALVGSIMFGAWFWIRGAYKNKAARQNLLTTLAGTVIDMIPFINDMPIMIIEVACVIIATRREDRANALAKAKHAVELAHAKEIAAANDNRAANAAANARAMGPQTMSEAA